MWWSAILGCTTSKHCLWLTFATPWRPWSMMHRSLLSIFVTMNLRALAIFLYSVLYHHVSFVSLLVSFKIGSGRNSCFARGCKNYSRWVVPSSGSEFLWFHQEKIGSADQACQSTDLKISHADLVQKSTFPWVSLLFLYSWWLWWWKATMDDHFPRVKALPLQPPCAVVIWSSSHIPTSFFLWNWCEITSWWGG